MFFNACFLVIQLFAKTICFSTLVDGPAKEVKVEKKHLVDTIPILGKTYTIKFDLLPVEEYKPNTRLNIIRFGISISLLELADSPVTHLIVKHMYEL